MIEGNLIRTNGVSLNCRVVGGGPPLCLIIGFRLSGGAWPQAFVDMLAEHFSVILYDCRGTGTSEKPLNGYDMATMAADVAGLLDRLGFARAHILGYSMGGAVAQEFALEFPERVDRLVLFATFAGIGFSVPAPWAIRRRVFEVQGLSAEAAARQMWPVTYSSDYLREHLPAVEAQMRREIAFPTPDHVARGQLAGLHRFSSGFRLWRLRAPTLVATGDEDLLIPALNSRILACAIPKSRLEILSGLGHRAIWEAPEEMAQLIGDFLRVPVRQKVAGG